MIDGVASNPFSAQTFLTEYKPTGNTEKVIKVSRERYAEERLVIEEKIMRWSGMVGGEEPLESAGADEGESESVGHKEQNHIYLHEEELETGQHSKRVDDAHRVAGHGSASKPKITALNGTRYPTVCFHCGKPTDVPFKPDPSRPTYCVECYAKVQEEKRKQVKEDGVQKKSEPEKVRPPLVAIKTKVLKTPEPISLREALGKAPPPIKTVPQAVKNMLTEVTLNPVPQPVKKIKPGEIVIFDDV